jgi:hypothetical protein
LFVCLVACCVHVGVCVCVCAQPPVCAFWGVYMYVSQATCGVLRVLAVGGGLNYKSYVQVWRMCLCKGLKLLMGDQINNIMKPMHA